MTKMIKKTKTRKFKEQSAFSYSNADYYLLPFTFIRLNSMKELLVNEMGEFLMVPTGTVQKIIEKDNSIKADQELYRDLQANFFITEEKIPALLDIMATKYRTKKSFLDHYTTLHIFVISLRCNHTCHYCQVSRVSQNKLAFDMSIHHIDKGIEMMMQSPSPHITMEFQGGEALFAYENIVYAIQKAENLARLHQKSIHFVVCTNLSIINEEMLQFFKTHEVLISTSLDGPAFIHNKNRPKSGNDSYELTVQAINVCRSYLGEDRISALLTTTLLSLDHPDEIVDEYFRLNFKSIFLRPISPYGFAVKNQTKNHYDIAQFLPFYKKALEHIIDYNLQGFFFREDYATIILKKILTPFPVGYVDLQSPAGMINNVIVFNYDGHVYASDESRMLAEMNDDTFQLGHLDTHSYQDIFYGQKTRALAEIWNNETLPGCSDCAFQSYCGADPVFNYATQGDPVGHRPTSAFCEKNMAIIKHLFELMEDKDIFRVFRHWISGKN